MVSSVVSVSNLKKYAVSVQHLSKSYGSNVPVLLDVSMHVEHGIIYGLLGSSGCGKSTLLSCILNLRESDAGEVLIFGENVSNDKEMNCRNIGYMPQDLAMCDHLTVEEMMKYFSKLYGMDDKKFKERMNFLEDLIDMKGFRSRRIINLSGGQKRRVSLSLSLLHNPKLLILDEPTVGLDPLLRERLWQYLYNLTVTDKTTIIITTHYIEEVKRANKVGVMRKGYILVEEDPALLMRHYNTEILEEAVRNICYNDAKARKPSTKSIRLNTVTTTFKNKKSLEFGTDQVTLIHSYRKVSNDLQPDQCQSNSIESRLQDEGIAIHMEASVNNKEASTTNQNSYLASFKRSLAYSHVTWINFTRNPMFIILVIFLPPFILLVAGAVVGVEPKYTSVGVVNHEIPNWSSSCSNSSRTEVHGNVSQEDMLCDISTLSCDFINFIQSDGLIKPVQHLNEEEAFHAVSQGKTHGYIKIPQNFSQSIVDRAAFFRFAPPDIIEGTEINVKMDFTDYVTTILVIMSMYYGFFSNFVPELTDACKFDFRFLSVPFSYRPPVYGEIDGGSSQDYALPAMIPGIIFIITLAVTPLVLLSDMKCGLLERTKTAGLRNIEWMIGLVLTVASMAFLQAAVCFIVLQYILKFWMVGDPLIFIGMCFLISLCGGSLGLLLGVVIKDAFTVIVTAIFLFPVVLLHSGVLRPEESLPRDYRTFVYYCFPTSAMARALQFVMNRGVGLCHPQVWMGVVITLGWSTVYSLLSFLIYKFSS